MVKTETPCCSQLVVAREPWKLWTRGTLEKVGLWRRPTKQADLIEPARQMLKSARFFVNKSPKPYTKTIVPLEAACLFKGSLACQY